METVVEPATVPAAPSTGERIRGFLKRNVVAVAFVALFAVAAVASKGAFVKPTNLINVLAQNCVAGVLAVGQTLVILTAGIDLSLGYITGLAAMVMLMAQGWGFWLAFALGLAVGLVCGVINGVLVSVMRVPAFIGTLGMMQVAMGISYVLGNGVSVYEKDHEPLLFGYDKIGPIPAVVIVWALVTALAWFVTKRTRYGEYIYAVGGNPRTARASGIPTTRVLIFVYTFAAFCSVVAAVLSINRLGYTQPNLGDTLQMASIAPVVVGGTSLLGGVGGVGKTIAGVLVVGILNNIMVLLGVNQSIQRAVQGVIIIGVVFLFVRQDIANRNR
ncbi:MAG: ABC transporter permease [Propionibacteriaceae bacterium]|jgi:putative xylitol transport system permease protein|nr:ABC transporter permease [Propionibacteriaceae bacterium]